MSRIKSARSDVSDADEGVAERELELAKLQNRYRVMQGDRQAYTEESQNVIRRQRTEILSLEKEREELLKEMRLAESKSNQNKDEVYCDKLRLLAETRDQHLQRIEEEKAKHVELDSKIREWERRIHKQQSNMGGALGGCHHTIRTSKKIRTLENRLDNMVKKYNHVLTANATLREEIESLRIERKRFDNLYKKLDKVLSQHRQEIAELIETSTQAYEQREEAQSKMLQIREKADKDLAQHNAEMKELVRVIDHDRCLKEFMNMKISDRQEDEQLTAWKAKKYKEAVERRAAAEDSVETYEAAFSRMQKLTGERDLDKLVETFIEKEDRNFALFNFVNEQNNSIEMCTEQIQDLRDQIDRFYAQDNALEKERQAILAVLDSQRQTAASCAERSRERQTAIDKILDQLTSRVDSLFRKIGCDRSGLEGMLGSSTETVDKNNIIQYLGLIEQRTNELLIVQNYTLSRSETNSGVGFDPQRSSAPLALLGEGPGPPAQHLLLLPPSLADDFESGETEDDAEGLRPLSREILQQKVIKTVKRREVEAKKDPYLYLTAGPSKSKMKVK